MPCFQPLTAFRVVGVKGVYWSEVKAGKAGRPVQLPCGQCIGCRLSKAREWTLRCVHESKLHEANSFITLTYADAHLPADYSVSLEDYQKFLKRLRDRLPVPVRFMGCGEYGGAGQRPHYHFLIFGWDFPDRTLWRRSASGALNYRSALLEEVWPYGHCEVGLFTPATAGYLARYTLKKQSGQHAARTGSLERVHPLTGECVTVRPEFCTMSRRPGIGAGWYERFAADAFPSDFLILEGAKVPVPKFYRKRLAEADEVSALQLKAKRVAKAKQQAHNNTPDRLAVREYVQLERASRLKRELE